MLAHNSQKTLVTLELKEAGAVIIFTWPTSAVFSDERELSKLTVGTVFFLIQGNREFIHMCHKRKPNVPCSYPVR